MYNLTVMDWRIFLITLAAFNVFAFFYSLWQCAFKNNPFGRCHLAIFGSFVWGDAVVFSLFWVGLCVVTLSVVPDVNFFLFCASVFFIIRGLGETIYWLNQQFSKVDRNPPKNFWMERIFPGESVWFAYQIIWQVVTAVALIAAVYFGVKWLR